MKTNPGDDYTTDVNRKLIMLQLELVTPFVLLSCDIQFTLIELVGVLISFDKLGYSCLVLDQVYFTV